MSDLLEFSNNWVVINTATTNGWQEFDTSLLERETTSIFARRNSGKILFIFHKSRWQNIFTNRAVILVIFVFEFLNMKADSNFMDYKVMICILYPGNIQNIIICN